MGFTTGSFPNCLKKAVILPLFKKGDIYIYHYLSICNIINPSQFGFHSVISTQDAIIYLTEKMYSNLNNFSLSIGIYIDFSKALNTVNRSIILRKLEKYGTMGTALNLFQSYLSGRRQAVRVGHSFSDFYSINLGVPQGSVLGPIVYLIKLS